MHQPSRSTVVPRTGPDFGEGTDRVSLTEMASFLREFAGSILRITALFFVAAFVYAIVAEPVYTAVAQIMLEPSKARTMLDEQNRPETAVDQARIESNIEILKSDQLALDVVRKLQLSRLPEFAAPTGEVYPERYAVLAFANYLSARRVGQSLVIEIAFRFGDPVLAANITNGLVDAYMARETAVKSDAVDKANKWLYERQFELHKQTQEAVAELQRYRQEHRDQSPETTARLSELENQALTFQRMHDAFLQKFNDTIQKVSFPEPDARVISAAAVPIRRSHPKRLLIIGFATVLGLGIGIVLALVRRNLDQTLKTSDQLHGKVDYWGSISQLPKGRASYKKLLYRFTRRPQVVARLVSMFRDPLLTTAAERRSSWMTGEFYNIKEALDCATDERKPRFIGVAAAREKEGTTTVAANLAALYALCGARTLLVDSCVDNPTASRALHQNAQEKVVRPLKDQKLGEQVEANGEQMFSVLRAGHMTGVVNIADWEGPCQAAGELAALREKYEVVIFDLPALARSPDAHAIARFLDAIVLVAERGATPLASVLSAVDTLRSARAEIVGVVLNKVKRA
jgi:polysaccharide biosynthesis transport protein